MQPWWYILQDLNVSAHHWVTAWTSWYQPFFWNWNVNAQWWSDTLKCQRRRTSMSLSSPRSVTGQVFPTVRALDTISTSAFPSECHIMNSRFNLLVYHCSDWLELYQCKIGRTLQRIQTSFAHSGDPSKFYSMISFCGDWSLDTSL